MLTGSRLKATLVALAAGLLLVGFVPAGSSTSGFAPQLVTVDAHTRAQRNLLNQLGLDVTEHAGHDYVEVVLHSAADVDLLRANGFTWDVRIANLFEREAEIRRLDAAYAAATDVSPLPSGRDTYRVLEDYNAEMEQLAADNPAHVKLFELPHTSLEGKTIYGLEIFGGDVNAPQAGEPTFALMGLHHAREWPSGEHTIEFAYELVNGLNAGDERITNLLAQARAVIVPVVNPDGFEKSVNDGLDYDDSGFTNAYKRKNCRVVDGAPAPPPLCDAAKSPSGLGVGIDLNRNYGTFHGGPGASNVPADATYHGPSGFSEPETQNIRELVSTRQVTTLITNHTYGNLILRPNGVAPDTIGPDGNPVGFAPDEEGMKDLGAAMAAQNGYTNQHGWELYDTTGTTEDWSYNAAGGYGYTFEIGPDEFHPPYEEVVAEYVGDTESAGEGLGNGEAFMIAFENAVDTSTHSVLQGTAPAGSTLTLSRTAPTPTWEGSFDDTITSAITVGNDGAFAWHVNPSTRPLAMPKVIRELSEPIAEESYDGINPGPSQSADHPFEVTEARDLLRVHLDWPLPDDMDLEVFYVHEDGTEESMGSSTSFIQEKETVEVENAPIGNYIARVTNFASGTPIYTVTKALHDVTMSMTTGEVEAWTLSCALDGQDVDSREVVVDRGAAADVGAVCTG